MFEVLPETWITVTDEERLRLETELKREVSHEHPLFGLSGRCLARRADRDDFLFSFSDAKHPFAVVHLTWRVEKGMDWPWTVFFLDANDFDANWRRIFD